jgi:hypothetical protein
MKPLHNKASFDVLLVSDLRKQLKPSLSESLKLRLSVSAVDADKSKKMQKAWAYLEALSMIDIIESELPEPFHKDLWIERVWGSHPVMSGVATFSFVLLIAFGFTSWNQQESSFESTETIASIHFAQNRNPDTPDSLGYQQSQGNPNFYNEYSNNSHVSHFFSLGFLLESLKKPESLKGRSPLRLPASQSILRKSERMQESQSSAGQASVESLSLRGKSSEIEGSKMEAKSAEIKVSETFVIRASLEIKVSSLEDPSVGQVTDFLKQYNPIKAGQVDLGWKKEENLLYYHFMTKDEFEDDIKEGLLGMGVLKWSKDPHPRRLPQGHIRYILEVILKEDR